jgi:hypothetical protein
MSSGQYHVISNAFESAGVWWHGSSKAELAPTVGLQSRPFLWLDSMDSAYTYGHRPSFIVSAYLEAGGLTGGGTTMSS